VFGEALVPGAMLGEYQIEREIGRGGMGTVYAARHPTIGKRVAIKVLEFSFSCDRELVKRFTDEARAVNKIGHPYIIDVFSFGKLADGRQYFVMEFLEGETVASWLAKGRPDFAEARRLLLQVCEALEAAHREGVIHRDLKPENLWIARPKHGLAYIKVLDFGIAKLIETHDEKGATKTGMIMGTPQFMSPEQCVGRGVDHRTDIYALGAILFCVYCGRPPFEGESAAELIAAQLYSPPPKPSTLAAIPPGLEALILSCLDKDPANRPASAAELGLRLKDVAAVGGAITAVHAPLHRGGDAAAKTRDGYAPATIPEDAVVEPDVEGVAKNRWPVAVAIGTLIAAVGVLLWLGTKGHQKPAAAPVLAAPATSVETVQHGTVPPSPAARPAEPPAAAELAAEPAPRSSGTRPKLARPSAGTPSPTSLPAPEAKDKRKPSRAAQEGLIQENPF
jgi:hypothetical protein